MAKKKIKDTDSNNRGALPKCPTGISGLDAITEGGLPLGRPTLVCGAAGCGKTMLGMEFLVRGAEQFGDPGVCMSFEESEADLAKNVLSLGMDLNRLSARKKLLIDYVRVERSEIEESGEYDLSGIFVRLGHAIDSIGAKRVLLDTVESLFAGLENEAILRSELRRLFRWLKEKGVTAVITGERGTRTLTRHGLEEYISDCVIVLEQRLDESVFTRRLRVVKYRGSSHGTNEYPFLIDEGGISVFPVTSLRLEHRIVKGRISTGVPALDEMLGGEGYQRGSTILVSGTAGTGKTSLAAHLIDAACKRKERVIYFGFEESTEQFLRNMKSIGLDLGRCLDAGRFRHEATRPTTLGVEMHLVKMLRIVQSFQPSTVAIDPISSLLSAGSRTEVYALLLRMIDLLKREGITCMLTSLTAPGDRNEGTQTQISSLVDTWLLLRSLETAGERNRTLYVLKSRGTAHSNQVREFLMSGEGIELRPAYLGPGGVLTGSARLVQEAADRAAQLEQTQRFANARMELQQKRKLLEVQLAALQAEVQSNEHAARQLEKRQQAESQLMSENRAAVASSRQAVAQDEAKPTRRRRSRK